MTTILYNFFDDLEDTLNQFNNIKLKIYAG